MSKTVQTEHLYVHKDPSVCGGDPVVVGTRIPVRLIYQRVRAGESIESVQRAFPRLTPAQIYNALSYVHDHLDEIEDEIRREDETYRQGKAPSSV